MTTTTTLPGRRIVDVIPAGNLVKYGIATVVPIVSTPWFDDRQAYEIVHDYLERKNEGRFEEYRGCRNYAAGVCAGTGGAGMLCLFHESDNSLAWGLARRWQRVQTQDGTVALQRCRM
ncbi:MAG: hypothetical protein R6X16_12335 [Anaerolineae bacterium]